jgi:hypothetical protein
MVPGAIALANPAPVAIVISKMHSPTQIQDDRPDRRRFPALVSVMPPFSLLINPEPFAGDWPACGRLKGLPIGLDLSLRFEFTTLRPGSPDRGDRTCKSRSDGSAAA